MEVIIGLIAGATAMVLSVIVFSLNASSKASCTECGRYYGYCDCESKN